MSLRECSINNWNDFFRWCDVVTSVNPLIAYRLSKTKLTKLATVCTAKQYSPPHYFPQSKAAMGGIFHSAGDGVFIIAWIELAPGTKWENDEYVLTGKWSVGEAYGVYKAETLSGLFDLMCEEIINETLNYSTGCPIISTDLLYTLVCKGTTERNRKRLKKASEHCFAMIALKGSSS